jgi:hypothetical protein
MHGVRKQALILIWPAVVALLLLPTGCAWLGKHVTDSSRFYRVCDDMATGLDGECLLLKEQIHTEKQEGIEGQDSTAKLVAWKSSDYPDPGKRIWTIAAPADKAEMKGHFYRVTKYGCCLALDVSAWFDLRSGKKVFTSNFDLLELDEGRYLTWHDSGSAPELREEMAGNNSIGLLQYGAIAGRPQKLLVRSKDEKWKWHEWQTPAIWVSFPGGYWSASGGGRGKSPWELVWKKTQQGEPDLSEFSVRMRWYDDSEIVIPVKNGKLQYNQASVTEKLILEPVE